jgi:hypothetical protein
MTRSRKNQQGIALLLAMLAALVILGAITVVVYRVHTAKRMTDEHVFQAQLDEACHAGIDMGVERIWNQYVTGNGNTTGNLASYVVFISAFVPNNEDLNGNGEQDEEESDLNGDDEFDIAAPAAIVSDQEPHILPSGVQIQSLTISRTEDITGMDIAIRCTASVGGRTKSSVQTVRIAGARFEGFEYGVLANNINCILCHTELLSLDLDMNSDPNEFGTFNRIKVAALESLMVRYGTDTFAAHSEVAGTVYTRGSVYDQYGRTYSPSGLASSTFKGFEFSTDNGKIIQDGSGGMTQTSFSNAGTDGDGTLEQFANLYVNYPEEENQMTDGNMPTSFPAPYPDENGDRHVNDGEFAPIMASSDGSISGGVVFGVPEGSTYSGGDALPATSNEAQAVLAAGGSYDGNLILVGTEANPIVIDKKISVNGDLVIKGPVKGWGQLLVRGNAYVTGDVTYADAPGEFGVAADGTKNGLALTAGGSIVIGDYLTIWAKDDRGSSSMWYDEWIDTRQEHKSNYTSRGYLDVGYFDDGVVDEGWTQASGERAVSFTTSEFTLFNAMEHEKAQADPSYTPRYYQIRETQPIYEYVGSSQDAMQYDVYGLETISDLGGAAIHSLNPKNYWLTEDQLRHFWHTDEMTRPDSGRPLQFDGLLYSNNSIFCVTHSKQYHNSNTHGEMIVRGSIVTADLGVFVPGKDLSSSRDALKLYYDPRVNDFFRIEDTTRVEFSRTVYRSE